MLRLDDTLFSMRIDNDEDLGLEIERDEWDYPVTIWLSRENAKLLASKILEGLEISE